MDKDDADLAGHAPHAMHEGAGAMARIRSFDDAARPDLRRLRAPAAFPADLRADLAEAAVAGDLDGALAILDAERDRGTPLRQLREGLIGDTARALGTGWETDRLSFFDVTAGLSTLSRLLGRLESEGAAPDMRPRPRRVLLATAPGDDHDFGLRIVAQRFREAGWHAATLSRPDAASIRDALSKGRYPLIGLSLGSDRCVAPVGDLIGALRARHGHGLRILLGGSAIDRAPGLARRLGADAAGIRTADPVQIGEKLLTSNNLTEETA